ncbi:MAG: sugar ABC transporter permease [Coriobacteriia bacterium]|nr:sugar ABC transporter permease [Coriobacteriia bacterium]
MVVANTEQPQPPDRTPPSTASNKNTAILYRMYRARWIYVALIPSFALLAVFKLYPAIDAIVKSFYFWKTSNLALIRFVGFDNYAKLLGDKDFWTSFGTLSIFLVWGFITTFAVVMPVTYLVFKLGEGRWGKFVQRMYVIPMMVPAMVGTLYWRFFFEYNFGILNTGLRGLGLESLTHVWLGEKATALPALLFMGFPWVGGFGFLILLAGFQGIDEALHEAAQLDGASPWQIFLRVDVPLIVPQARLLIILGMISGIQQFGTQMIMTNGGPAGSTTVPGLIMYKTAFTYSNLGYGTTMGVALFAIIMVITLFLNKYVRRMD